METVEIDPQTGLAKLPKGCFWRVSENRLRTGEVTSYGLSIIERQEKTKTHLSWFGKEKTVTEVIENELYSDYVWVHDKHGRPAQFAMTITETDLRLTTMRVLGLFLEEIASMKEQEANEETSKSFLGDYPPKTIN